MLALGAEKDALAEVLERLNRARRAAARAGRRFAFLMTVGHREDEVQYRVN
jgi:hypothetical protein